jgi:hypothetical protein
MTERQSLIGIFIPAVGASISGIVAVQQTLFMRGHVYDSGLLLTIYIRLTYIVIASMLSPKDLSKIIGMIFGIFTIMFVYFTLDILLLHVSYIKTFIL